MSDQNNLYPSIEFRDGTQCFISLEDPSILTVQVGATEDKRQSGVKIVPNHEISYKMEDLENMLHQYSNELDQIKKIKTSFGNGQLPTSLSTSSFLPTLSS